MSKSWSARLKKRMRTVYGDVCPSCYQIMCFGVGVGPFATLDHVVPISRGGTEDEDNFQLLCNKCNGKKGDKLESRVDGGPRPLPPLSPPTPVNRGTISKFWGLRCGMCGKKEPCLEHDVIHRG